MKVHLKALGCRLNEAELEQWSIAFQADGHNVIDTATDADLMVLNTCAVTNDASRKSRNLINRLHRENSTAKLVITGCHASLNPDEVADTHGVDLVVSNDKKSSLPEIISSQLMPATMPLRATNPDDIALYNRHRQRAFIKVQDGCRYRCAFCIVTHARGNEVSRPVDDIIQELNFLHSQGVQEAVLTGVHVGGYGSDLDSNLYQLVETILADTDMPRIRFASVEPWDLGDQFFDLFSNPRLMPHMHLPLQSGSDTVLKRMSRRCKTEDFAQLVKDARNTISGFNITTDIIAGFPGETEQEWRQTMEFVEQTGFGHIHIFPYSPRSGTKAANMPDQVELEIKRARCKELAELAERLKANALEQALGETTEVLWESPKKSTLNGHQHFNGYTNNFLRAQIDVPDDMDLSSNITPVKIISMDQEKLFLNVELR